MEEKADIGGGRLESLSLSALGDSALLFAWPGEGDTNHAEIAAIAAGVRRLDLSWVKELVPAYRTLAVHLDIDRLLKEAGVGGGIDESFRFAVDHLYALIDREADEHPLSEVPLHVRLPVVFGGEHGPDLAACAQRSGMMEEEFVRQFCSEVYDVAMIGFAPGFPYLAGLPLSLTQPRHSSPRLKVPPGAVGIAGSQTGVYPVQSPGGWQLIGRTFTPLFRPEAETPFLLAAGDRVSFVPVVAEGWEAESIGGEPPASAGSSRNEPVLEVHKPGLLTTIQDAGRPGWQAYGVSIGGAMDTVSLRTANWLVGNGGDAAVLEMTMIGAVIRMERGAIFAVCGADMEARVDGQAIPMDRPVWLRAGATLTFGRAQRGCRAYLAVAGGFDAPLVLGSRSTDARARIGGIGGRALAAADRLAVASPSAATQRLAHTLQSAAQKQGKSWAAVTWSAEMFATAAAFEELTLRVMAGSEWDEFGAEARRRLLEETYRVDASSDRMGLRLSGPALARERLTELSSHGVAAGTVQVPAGGQPIILGAGCQPTGGYPKIAHIIGADLPLLAQCRPGDRLRFTLVDLAQAWEIRRELEQQMRVLQAGIKAALLDPKGAETK